MYGMDLMDRMDKTWIKLTLAGKSCPTDRNAEAKKSCPIGLIGFRISRARSARARRFNRSRNNGSERRFNCIKDKDGGHYDCDCGFSIRKGICPLSDEPERTDLQFFGNCFHKF